MDDKDLKKFIVPIMIIIFAVLSFFVIKPLATAIFLGLLFAYIFYPVYKKLNKRINSSNGSASIIVFGSLVVFVIPPLLFTPMFIKQLFDVYLSIKNTDFSALIFKLLPALGSSKPISGEIVGAISNFNAKISEGLLAIFQQTMMNIPEILFGIVVLLFTFFFALKAGPNMKTYLSAIIPLPKEHKQKFYEKFEQVTDSVIYGHIIGGLVQGTICGIGYFLFGVPNALLLTVLTIIAGMLPVIGAWLIWMPADLFLFINGNNVAGMQLLIFGLFMVNWVETLLRPIIVAEKAEMNEALALIGAVGGLYAFGIMGLVLGPLVLAYLVLFIELYKDDKAQSIIIVEHKETPEKK